MVIPVEILSKCRYYHGEERAPENDGQYFGIFWNAEWWYCQNYADDKKVIQSIVSYRKFFPNDKEDGDPDIVMRSALFGATMHNAQFPPEYMAKIFKEKILPAYLNGSTLMKM